MSEIKPVYQIDVAKTGAWFECSKEEFDMVKKGALEVTDFRILYPAAAYEALKTDCTKLLAEQDQQYNKQTNELIARHSKQIADLVKAYDQKLLDAEKVFQESNSTWHRLLTLEEERIKELEQAASINQEYVTEMHRINGMAISAGLEVPNPNSPYFSERSAIAYLQRQSYEQGWKDGNSNVKLMNHKD